MFSRKKGKVLKTKFGYNPNCSSTSSLWGVGYFILIVGLIQISVIITPLATLFIQMFYKRKYGDPSKRGLGLLEKARYESFGGIVRFKNPAITYFVDRIYMEQLGFVKSDAWSKEESKELKAPIDVHFALTNKCPMGCKNCYKSSTATAEQELSIQQIKDIIDVLARMEVFSIAFGGGEPFACEDIFEIAEYTKSKGITPNITTNGYFITKDNAARCKVFDHIHISLDYPDSRFDLQKNTGAFDSAINAIDLLNMQHIHLGINCLITRDNFELLEDLVKLGVSKGIKDFTFLRLKPVGKAQQEYQDLKLTQKQNIDLFPKLRKLIRKYGITVQADCSLFPMLAYHKPSATILELFGIEGCVGGENFIEIKEDGQIRSCSFSSFYGDNAANLEQIWSSSQYLEKYRKILDSIEMPCSKCDYLSLCRGGCHVISEATTEDFYKPDPECPIVVKYRLKNKN